MHGFSKKHEKELRTSQVLIIIFRTGSFNYMIYMSQYGMPKSIIRKRYFYKDLLVALFLMTDSSMEGS